MLMRWFFISLVLAVMLPSLLPESTLAAQVKPLEVVTERILVLETERLAGEHAMNCALVRRALERLDKQMNIMSRERTLDSLKLLSDAREAAAVSARSAAGLSSYVAQVKESLKEKGHGRFIPLEKLNDEIEKPYHEVLDRFLATAIDFVQFCHDNLEAIATGQAAENKRYDAYYTAYLKEMDAFNSRSMQRSQQLADWSSEYPALLEYLPR